MFYDLMTKGLDYLEQGAKKYRNKITKFIQKKALEFGFAMLPTNT